MNANIASAILRISDDATAKRALNSVLNIAPASVKELIAELLLGTMEIPEKIPSTVIKDGITFTLKSFHLDDCSVHYRFEASHTRYFNSQEAIEKALKNRHRYDGVQNQSEEYPLEAVITYDDSRYMSLHDWLSLAKQEE